MATQRTTKAKPATATPQVPTPRQVANQARPSRITYQVQLENLAKVHGWKYTFVPQAKLGSEPRIVHIWANKPSAAGMAKFGGAVLVHPNGNTLTMSYFGKAENQGRMDAAYLWLPGTGQGRRVDTMGKVADVLANGGQAVPTQATNYAPRAKATQAETAPVAATAAPKATTAAKATRKPKATAAKAKASKAA